MRAAIGLAGGQRRVVHLADVVAVVERAPRHGPVEHLVAMEPVDQRVTVRAVRRDRGAAVLVVSSDLEEVMTIADRVGIMVSGRLRSIHDAADMSMAQVVAEIGAE